MKPTRIIACSALALVCAMPALSQAADYTQTRETTRTYYSPARVQSGTAISPDAYEYADPMPDTTRERLFYSYEGDRERCQHYVAPPEGYIYDGCDIVSATVKPAVTQAKTERVETQHTERKAPTLLPSVANYQVYFDFDKSNIRSSETSTLARVSSEIKTYDPVEVTVTGHADTSGPADYNQTLSRERAESVVHALESRGIPSRVLDEEARGETDLAVDTPDGVREPMNRRVTIDFRR